MITDILTYLLHVAPSLAVVIVILYYQNIRMSRLEDRLCEMLNECMTEVFKHLENS